MNRIILNLFLFSLINLIILPKNLSSPIAESQSSTRKPPAKIKSSGGVNTRRSTFRGDLETTTRQHSIIKDTPSDKETSELRPFKQPQPPPDAPKVGRGQGGASRGICQIDNSISANIIPLIPSSGWGLTASESPTLWMHVSYSDRWQRETPPMAELSVEDRKTDTKLEPKTYSIELPKTSGIFSVALPQTLKSEQWYRWYLVINCQKLSSFRNDVLQIEGFLQQKELNNSTHNSKLMSSAERVSYYTEQHIWYDAFHEAVLLHCNDRSNNEFKNYWKTLLESDAVNLEKIGDRPIFCPN